MSILYTNYHPIYSRLSPRAVSRHLAQSDAASVRKYLALIWDLVVERGQLLMRQRGELLERPNAHLYETGGMRRTHLRGHGNILKRLLVHVAACNLGLWMRTLTGVGTPRGLQGSLAAVWAFCFTLWVLLRDQVTAHRRPGLDLRIFTISRNRFALIPRVL